MALVAACGSWPRATELYELLGPDVLGVNGQLKRLPWHRATVLCARHATARPSSHNGDLQLDDEFGGVASGAATLACLAGMGFGAWRASFGWISLQMRSVQGS